MQARRDGQLFRVWIASYSQWRPSSWNDTPPTATAIELAEDRAYSAEEAALFLHGFNACMLREPRGIWAVALPISLRYEGDAYAGMTVRGFRFAAFETSEAAARICEQ